ncbi:MAG: hypothetical protein AAF849_09775 [Bacteroidota bacterium]
MKKRASRGIFTITFMLLGICLVYAQVIPVNSTIQHNKDERTCLMVRIAPEAKEVKKAWEDYLKDKYDFKLDGIGLLSNKEMLKAEKIMMKDVSNKAMNLYTEVVEDGEQTRMKVFAAYGYDFYINERTMPLEYASLRNVFENFLKSYLPNYYEKGIEETEDFITELKDDREDLNEAIVNDEEQIKELEQEIEDRKEELKANRKKLADAEIKLEKKEEELQSLQKKLQRM